MFIRGSVYQHLDYEGKSEQLLVRVLDVKKGIVYVELEEEFERTPKGYRYDFPEEGTFEKFKSLTPKFNNKPEWL